MAIYIRTLLDGDIYAACFREAAGADQRRQHPLARCRTWSRGLHELQDQSIAGSRARRLPQQDAAAFSQQPQWRNTQHYDKHEALSIVLLRFMLVLSASTAFSDFINHISYFNPKFLSM